MGTRSFLRRAAVIFPVMVLALFLGSCELSNNYLQYDRSAEADRQDYRDVMAPAPMPEKQDAQDIPEFSSVVSLPSELKLPSPLVTVSVNQTVALRELLFELANDADVDLELDPSIQGSIIFTAKERPFDEVVNRICEMAGLRYTFKNNVLRVERDRPYLKSYSLDYLNITRTGDSSINTEVKLSSGGEGEENGGGSNSSISANFKGDLWAELDDGLTQIQEASTASDTFTLATTSDPVAMPANPLPAAPTDPNAPASANPPPLPGSPQTGQMAAGAPPTLNVAPAPTVAAEANAPMTYSVSKQSGIVTVFGSERQHKLVQMFLDEFKRRSTTQVLIEAKVLQVDLTDEYATGVDWDTFNLTGLATLTPSFPVSSFDPIVQTGSFTAVLGAGNDLRTTVQMLARFGTVRALSSPRITALNNQPAIVSVGENVIYFEIDQETETTTSDPPTQNTTIDTTVKTVFEGVLLNVIPVANADTGEIQLVVRPSITRITKFVDDPGAAAIDGALPSEIPQMESQEMDSFVKLQSGQTLVMGGLMRDINRKEEEGVPVLGDMPIVSSLFKKTKDSVKKTELVIFLKATIVGGSNVDDMDRKIYKNFSLDRRPSAM